MKTVHFLTILILATAYGCNSKGDADTHDQNDDHAHDSTEIQGLSLADTAIYGLRLTAPAYHPTGDTLLLRGMVDAPPQSRIDVALPYGGLITSLNYYEGAYVKKGALIAEVQHNDYISLQEDFLRLSAEKAQMESALKRQEELKDKGSTSEKVYEEARNAYKSVDARMQGVVARMKLAGISPERVERDGIQEKVMVYAPISGYITAVNANIGTYVAANAPIYKMVDINHLHIELAVFPDHVSQLAVGQSVYFTTSGAGGRRHGNVFLISQDVKADSRTVNVHVHPDEDTPGLLPGMFVQATVHLSADSIYGLPRSAVAAWEGAAVGLALAGERFELVSFPENGEVGMGILLLPENEKRLFVTGNLQRAVSAYFGDSGSEAGHSH